MGNDKVYATVRRRGKPSRAENLDDVRGSAPQVAGPTTQVQQPSRHPTPQPSSNESSDDGASGPANDNGDDDDDDDDDDEGDDAEGDNDDEDDDDEDDDEDRRVPVFGPNRLQLIPGFHQFREIVTGGFYYRSANKAIIIPFNCVPVRNQKGEPLYYRPHEGIYVRPDGLQDPMTLHPQCQVEKDAQGKHYYVQPGEYKRVPHGMVPVRTMKYLLAYYKPKENNLYVPAAEASGVHPAQQHHHHTTAPQMPSTMPPLTGQHAFTSHKVDMSQRWQSNVEIPLRGPRLPSARTAPPRDKRPEYHYQHETDESRRGRRDDHERRADDQTRRRPRSRTYDGPYQHAPRPSHYEDRHEPQPRPRPIIYSRSPSPSPQRAGGSTSRVPPRAPTPPPHVMAPPHNDERRQRRSPRPHVTRERWYPHEGLRPSRERQQARRHTVPEPDGEGSLFEPNLEEGAEYYWKEKASKGEDPKAGVEDWIRHST